MEPRSWRAWLNTAQNLRASALVLWEARQALRQGRREEPAGGPRHADVAVFDEVGIEDDAWERFEHAPTFLLLAGLAVETLCKAVIVAREAQREGCEVADLPEKYTRGHSITTLIQAVGTTLTVGNLELIDRLQTYVTWAGRYPVPKLRQRVGSLTVMESDRDQLIAIFDRLEAAIL